MRAVVVEKFGGPEVLDLIEVDLPVPGRGCVRVRVEASTVNPIDVSTRAGRLTEAGLLAPAERIALGWDVAGIVDAVGEGVTTVIAGDRVIGLRDLMFTLPGAHAEAVVLPVSAVAPAPTGWSAAEAATLPLNGLTAIRSLDLTGLRAGDRLLVTGATGGVGGFILELARLRRIRTIAPAAHRDHALVARLGASIVVDRDAHLATAVREFLPDGVDAVIDAAVLGIAAHDTLRSGGTFVSLVAPFAPPPIRGTRVVVQEVHADGAELARLSALASAGHLTPRVADRFELGDVAAAHRRFEAGGARGRIVLEVAQGSA